MADQSVPPVLLVRPVEQGRLVAHTPRPGSEEFHSWRDHAIAVGELAAEFAEPFGAGDLLRLMGQVHDAGKATCEVQEALYSAHREARDRLGVPHKFEGAALGGLLAAAGKTPLAWAMTIANAGHHSGMPDRHEDAVTATLVEMGREPARLDVLVDRMNQELPETIQSLVDRCSLPDYLTDPSVSKLTLGRRLELFTRLCHSALVDADFLDTEAHFAGWSLPRRTPALGMIELGRHFHGAYAARFGNAPPSPLNDLRRDIFDRCRSAALLESVPGRPAAGVYRLPAQTGCGKTLASAAFALDHAVAFGKRRVVVAVPFTSITTQNAEVYRDLFSGLPGEVVLEHHSNIVDDETFDDLWRRQAAPNWDAEFVVTTTVQLFDSLFSNRPSSTRKLHRLVDSVVVLDEVQAIPASHLPAILTMLRDLSECFGVTVLLASATQPEFWELEVWDDVEFVDILPPDEVPELVQRVTFETRSTPMSWQLVADEVASEPQVMVVVNTQGAARELHAAVESMADGAGSCLHLSTRMTPRHRAEVLAEVGRRLSTGEPVRLVATQLVEAGVDLDFPVVWRAVAPAESVIQAAGRCNRNGGLSVRGGRVVVFVPEEGGAPAGDYRAAINLTHELFVAGPRRFDDPVDLGHYFREFYAARLTPEMVRDDTVTGLREELKHRAVANEFAMIPEDPDLLPVVVLAHGTVEQRRDLEQVLDDFDRDPTRVLSRHERRQIAQATVLVRARTDGPFARRSPRGIWRWEGSYDVRGCVSDDALIF